MLHHVAYANIRASREDAAIKGWRILLESCGGLIAKHDKALFLLGINSGFRISELLSLRVGDVWQAGR